MLYRSGQATDTLYIQGCSEETDIILFTIFTKSNVARMNFLMPNANAIHGNLFNRRAQSVPHRNGNHKSI